MQSKGKRGILREVVLVILTFVLIVGISIWKDGMYLIGVPNSSEVQSVIITYPKKEIEAKEITDSELIEHAVNLTGFLRYSLFEQPVGDGVPLVTVTYHLSDGGEVSVSANRETVWWNGEVHVIKDKHMFINLVEGIFF